MPELPDLTIYSKNLQELLVNKDVIEISIHRAKRLNVSLEDLNKALLDTILLDIRRNGKELFFSFSSSHTMSIHLMLKGQFDLVEDENIVKYKTLSIKFKDTGYLVISDPRGWATINLDAEFPAVPDALSPDFTLDYLSDKLKINESVQIKALLVDQNIVRGIGNAYADEILWESKIYPFSDCGKIPKEAVNLLYRSISKVLLEAINSIDQIAPTAINGEHREFLKIHVPDKEFSPTGKPIKTQKFASRTTYYTDEQIVY